MAIDIRVELSENVSARLTRAIALGNDLSPAMQAIANRLATATRLRFEREAGPDGKRWKPSQRAVEEGGQTLTDRGDLKGSIRSDWGPDFAAAGPEASGGAAIYAAIHQFGGTIRPKVAKALSFGGRIVAAVRIPARPYLGFDERDRAAIEDILGEHLGQAFSGGGAGPGAPA